MCGSNLGDETCSGYGGPNNVWEVCMRDCVGDCLETCTIENQGCNRGFCTFDYELCNLR